ncbi:hypothetical protein [Dokdonia pacifica]|uniref:Uncharacterized protein n=1 Tax=Dokdonia pacifica TaxID=1627892 RepID=A0A238VNK8_9FLAO|nr:hypothetical protein [Dokdonia pacifica]SNR35333.1 hypothetical protein SAMN06265376_10128 [Dokdonia pacifica]
MKIKTVMQLQNHTQHKTKTIALKTSKKRHSFTILNRIALLLLFGFFIGLSLTNNQLFIKEILIASGIICMLLLFKKNNK